MYQMACQKRFGEGRIGRRAGVDQHLEGDPQDQQTAGDLADTEWSAGARHAVSATRNTNRAAAPPMRPMRRSRFGSCRTASAITARYPASSRSIRTRESPLSRKCMPVPSTL